MDKLERLKIPAVVEDEKMEIIYDALKNGGGGGGGSVQTIGLTFDPQTGLVETDETVQEIVDILKSGKSITSVVDIGGDNAITLVQITFGVLSQNNGTFFLTANTQGGDRLEEFYFEADDLDSKFSASFGG